MDKKNHNILGILLGLILVVSYLTDASAFVLQDRISTAKGLAHYMTGQVYDLKGDIKRAAMEYKAAAEYDSSSYLIRLRLGVDYARLNMLDAAIQELKLVGEFNKEEIQSHYLLALIYSATRQYDKAAYEYEHILKTFSQTDPQNIEIYGYLGQLYYSQKKFDQALKQFESIYSIEPENADIMYLLGSLYVEVDRTADAVAILTKALTFDPEHDGCLNTLAYLYAEKEMKLDDALDFIKRAIAKSPDNGAYIDTLGWVYYKRKEYKKALDALKEANALLKDPIILDHIGDVYFKLNDFENAISSWEASLVLQPGQEQITQKLNEARNKSAHHKK